MRSPNEILDFWFPADQARANQLWWGKQPQLDAEIRDRFGPTLGAPLAMGYVETASSADGTPLNLMVRGKALPAKVAPMPFVPHRYFRG